MMYDAIGQSDLVLRERFGSVQNAYRKLAAHLEEPVNRIIDGNARLHAQLLRRCADLIDNQEAIEARLNRLEA